MQSNGARALLALAAVAVVVVAFFVLGGDDEAGDGSDDPPTTASQTETTTTAPADGGNAASDEPSGGGGDPPAEKVTTIVVEGGAPQGGVTELTYDKGDEVRFAVEADAADEVHVHGYDIEQEVGPGEPVEFEFPADLDGIYEVELHESAQQIAELTVNP